MRANGFAGELRATGNVLPDQLQFMLQVGFDSFEVNDRFPRDYWLRYLRRMSLTYQHDLADGKSAEPRSLRLGGEAERAGTARERPQGRRSEGVTDVVRELAGLSRL